MPGTLVLVENGREVARYSLDREQSTVGRHPMCSILINNPSMSRQHFVIVRQGESYIVKDLGGPNGIYVNGKKVPEAQLRHGDFRHGPIAPRTQVIKRTRGAARQRQCCYAYRGLEPHTLCVTFP